MAYSQPRFWPCYKHNLPALKNDLCGRNLLEIQCRLAFALSPFQLQVVFFVGFFFSSRLFSHFILLVPFLFLGVTVTFHAMLAVTYFSPNDDNWTSVKLYPGISSRRTFEVNFVFFRLLTSCLLEIRTHQGHI